MERIEKSKLLNAAWFFFGPEPAGIALSQPKVRQLTKTRKKMKRLPPPSGRELVDAAKLCPARSPPRPDSRDDAWIVFLGPSVAYDALLGSIGTLLNLGARWLALSLTAEHGAHARACPGDLRRASACKTCAFRRSKSARHARASASACRVVCGLGVAGVTFTAMSSGASSTIGSTPTWSRSR